MIIHDVEQGTPEWLKLRAMKPTSSMFSSIITSKGLPSEGLKDYAYTLAAEKYVGGPLDDGWQGNKFTDRGHKLEPETRADYEMTNQVTVQPVGFITDDLMRWGTSTDGLVGDDGLIEVKNLIAKRMMKLLAFYRQNKKPPAEYLAQCQGELFVAERQWCDLIFYHPQFTPVIHRVEADLEFHAKLKAQLIAVIAERDRILKLVA